MYQMVNTAVYSLRPALYALLSNEYFKMHLMSLQNNKYQFNQAVIKKGLLVKSEECNITAMLKEEDAKLKIEKPCFNLDEKMKELRRR